MSQHPHKGGMLQRMRLINNRADAERWHLVDPHTGHSLCGLPQRGRWTLHENVKVKAAACRRCQKFVRPT